MGTVLYEQSQWDPQIVCPNPGEPVRAGGDALTPITIPGASIAGDVQYTALAPQIRVEHKGGISMALAVSVSVLDITVQLATDAMGLVTSTANDVANAVNASAAARILVVALALNGGTGLAGVSAFVRLSSGEIGSVRPPLQSLTDRSRFMADILARFPLYSVVNAYCTSFDAMARQQIVIMPLPPHVVYLDAAGAVINQTFGAAFETYLDIRNVEGLPAAYDPSTFYYVYSKSDGTFVISKVAPDFVLMFRTGDRTQKYLFEFLTDASSRIYQFSRSGKEMFFNRMPQAFSGNIPAAPASQTIDFGPFVPPGCKQLKLQMHASHSDVVTGTPVGVARNITVRAEGSGFANSQPFTIGPVMQKITGGTFESDADFSFEMAMGKLQPDATVKGIVSTDTLTELVNVKMNVRGYSR